MQDIFHCLFMPLPIVHYLWTSKLIQIFLSQAYRNLILLKWISEKLVAILIPSFINLYFRDHILLKYKFHLNFTLLKISTFLLILLLIFPCSYGFSKSSRVCFFFFLGFLCHMLIIIEQQPRMLCHLGPCYPVAIL